VQIEGTKADDRHLLFSVLSWQASFEKGALPRIISLVVMRGNVQPQQYSKRRVAPAGFHYICHFPLGWLSFPSGVGCHFRIRLDYHFARGPATSTAHVHRSGRCSSHRCLAEPVKPLTSLAFSLMRNKSIGVPTMQTANAREQMIEQQVRAWDCSTSACSEFSARFPRSFRAGATAVHGIHDLEVPLPKGNTCCARVLRAGSCRLWSSRHRACARDWCRLRIYHRLPGRCERSVESIEVFPELAELAKSNLATLSIGNTQIVTADALATTASPQALRRHRRDRLMPIPDERFQRSWRSGRLFISLVRPGHDRTADRRTPRTPGPRKACSNRR